VADVAHNGPVVLARRVRGVPATGQQRRLPSKTEPRRVPHQRSKGRLGATWIAASCAAATPVRARRRVISAVARGHHRVDHRVFDVGLKIRFRPVNAGPVGLGRPVGQAASSVDHELCADRKDSGSIRRQPREFCRAPKYI